MTRLPDLVREFIAYYSRGGGCSNCGGLPHSTTCFVGRFEAALAVPPGDAPPHTCHDMNPPFPGPCRACELEGPAGGAREDARAESKQSTGTSAATGEAGDAPPEPPAADPAPASEQEPSREELLGIIAGLRDIIAGRTKSLQQIDAKLAAPAPAATSGWRDIAQQLINQWRERERRLCRQADAAGQTQYAHRLAAEAEGIARCADQLSNCIDPPVAAPPEGV